MPTAMPVNVMPATIMPAQTMSAPVATVDLAQGTVHSLRPVFITVLSVKAVVAAFLLASVSLSPPLSAESRYLADEAQVAAVN